MADSNENSSNTSEQEFHAKLTDETGGMAGKSPTQQGAPEDGGQTASVGSVMKEKMSAYKGNVWGYLCIGGAIGAFVGWLIALAASEWWLGGAVAGAIGGAAIGLYVVETRRF